MAQTKTDLANLALGHIGAVPPLLASVDTDATKPGQLCLLHIDSTRRALLRSFIWNFAKKRVTLTLPIITGAANNGAGLIRITAVAHGFNTSDRVTLSQIQGTTEANGTWVITKIDADHFDLNGSSFLNTWISGGYYSKAPAFEFIHQHTLPADMLRLVNLETPLATDVERILESGFILTDDPVLELIYIAEQTDYSTMDPLFYESLSMQLAIRICYGITQSNKLRAEIRDLYNESIRKARFVDSIEDPMKTMQANEWIESRTGLSSEFVRDPMT